MTNERRAKIMHLLDSAEEADRLVYRLEAEYSRYQIRTDLRIRRIYKKALDRKDRRTGYAVRLMMHKDD